MTSLVRHVGRLAGRAARVSYLLSRRFPGAEEVAPPLAETGERTAVPARSAVRVLDTAAPQAPGLGRSATSSEDTFRAGTERLRGGMADLLARSADPEQAQEHLYALILSRLAPDEARILSTLADATPFPALDVVEKPRFGRAGTVVLRNASTVGKAAGVALPEHVPGYVTRLCASGLTELSGEETALGTQYEVLLVEQTVLDAASAVSKAAYIRRTLRISALGLRFWDACAPERVSRNP